MNAQSMRKSRRAFCRRNKSQRGAGLGNSYTFGAPVGEVANYRASVVPMSSCGDASRPGFLSGMTPKGLPGLSGGRRRDEVAYLNDTSAVDYPDAAPSENTQMGGRYTTGFEVTGPGIPLATHTSIPCDVSTQNPLNQGYDIKSLVTSTGAQSLSPAPLKGGKRKGSRKSRKGSRKSRKGSRKSRKGSRKSRKGSRKSRKGSRKSRK